MVSDYELAIERNKAANRALLASLGIEKPLFQAPAPVKKRKKPSVVVEPSRKSARISEDKKSPHYGYAELPESDSDDGGAKTRRSKRARTKKTEKIGSTSTDADALIPTYINERNAHRLNPKRFRPDPKQHGEIPGIKVGHWWETRMQCSADGVHAPPVSGISGSGNGSAYSIALSGGYEDDVDEGFRFTFTGSGGRDLSGTAKNPKNLRTAPQSSDQQLVGGNLALSNSCESGLPVRVIRGYKATLGPPEGYRYDGLYKVVKAWCDVGMSGYKVWRFAFMRIDGQEPVDYKAGRPEDKEQYELEGADEDDSENSADPTTQETTPEATSEKDGEVSVKKDIKAEAAVKKDTGVAINKDTEVAVKKDTVAADKVTAAVTKKGASTVVKKKTTTTVKKETATVVKKDAKAVAKKVIVAVAKDTEPAAVVDNRRRSGRNKN
ncbi:uncharacterized protein LAJ45_07352 [Morchella importuna]|uniref:uncharacterized protein n=1 Tax=Morchella importuna TaxID=1174673 RepID=UPI001E8CB160|nr:uncharacterized protein LAJ45_07352 [Morchella importuna]KAH8148641.1 hypothetical protein LAJ45_07352 [Morchella importuna]